MNNEAFQKLVRDKAGVKTTKEIAREAVEAEFKGRGKRRRRDDDSSDSDSESHRDQADGKQSTMEKKPKEPSELQLISEKYRDRAQERRLGVGGNVGDHDGTVQVRVKPTADVVFEDVVEAFESGDRRKLQKLRTLQKETPDRKIASADEALAWLADPPPSTLPTTDLGKAMLTYLCTVYLPPTLPMSVSAAGRNVQRSQLSFSLIADPRDRLRSWETPSEEAILSEGGDNGWNTKATPCDDELLREIQRRLDRRNEKKQNDHHAKVQQLKEAPEPLNANKPEDDDIFDDVGDYHGDAIRDEGDGDAPTTAQRITKGSLWGDSTSGKATSNGMDDPPSLEPHDIERTETRDIRPLQFSADGYADDGIGMDFCARDYEDDDDSEDQKKASKPKKKSRRDRRAERSPS